MKLAVLAALAAFATAAYPAAYELRITQRDSDNINLLIRNLVPVTPTTDAFMFYDGATSMPVLGLVGSGLSWDGTTLSATAGSQVNSDWNAVSGVAQILNKPSLFDGTWTSLSGKPSFAAVATSGSYLDLTSKPTIPAAQVNSDWNSVSGLSQVLNKPSLATVATTGSYTDLTNKPAAPSQSVQTRTLNSAFQISTTRPTLVTYSVQITVTASIAGGQNGDVVLEVASDSGFTTNVQTLSIAGSGQTYTLAIALQGVQPQTAVVSGFVPTGYYTRLRTVNNTGTPTFSYRAGQEVLL